MVLGFVAAAGCQPTVCYVAPKLAVDACHKPHNEGVTDCNVDLGPLTGVREWTVTLSNVSPLDVEVAVVLERGEAFDAVAFTMVPIPDAPLGPGLSVPVLLHAEPLRPGEETAVLRISTNAENVPDGEIAVVITAEATDAK